MNGFALHGLDHLSATSLNLYAAAPALWVVEKLLRRRAPVGCAAHRGTAVEHGVSLGLFDPALAVADCQAAALAEFDRLAALSADPNRGREREAIPALVETALAELRAYGPPTPPPEGQRQHRVEVVLPEVPVPLAASAKLIEQLGTPREDGERWSARRQDSGRWAGALITSLLGCTEEQARTILDGYLKSQALRIVDYQSPKQRKERKGLEHDPQIVAAMRLQTQEDDDE